MRILITGHRGLIGSSLWDRLKDNHQLYGYDIKDLEGSNLLEKVDMIIHCASYCVIREIIKDTSLMMKNIQLTYQVIEKAKNDKSKIILMSSSRLNSDYYSPYVTGKKFLEDMARTYKDCYDVDNIIIRPETIWGYHQDDSRVIPNWIKLAKNNEDIIVFGDKSKALSPLFIEDFSSELVKIIDNFDDFKNRDPITITGEDMKVYKIIGIIKDFYNSKSSVIFREPELSQPQNVPIRKERDIILKNRLRENLKWRQCV
jgi:nucleoside-diphosphate-sugar epimerase